MMLHLHGSTVFTWCFSDINQYGYRQTDRTTTRGPIRPKNVPRAASPGYIFLQRAYKDLLRLSEMYIGLSALGSNMYLRLVAQGTFFYKGLAASSDLLVSGAGSPGYRDVPRAVSPWFKNVPKAGSPGYIFLQRAGCLLRPSCIWGW